MPRATFFVQIEPNYAYGYAPSETTPITSAKAVGITQSRPTKPKRGSLIVKLTVDVPEGAFRALQPEAVIVIPDSFIKGVPIKVEVQDANDGDDD